MWSLIRSPWYRSPATLSRLIRQRDWPWNRQIHNGRTMMLLLMMMMVLLLLMRLMRRVVICADPWMESLLLRMLWGQTPQVRLLMLLLLLLPHAVHFEVHLSVNKFKLSPKRFPKEKKSSLRLPVQSTFAHHWLLQVTNSIFNSLSLSLSLSASISSQQCSRHDNRRYRDSSLSAVYSIITRLHR